MRLLANRYKNAKKISLATDFLIIKLFRFQEIFVNYFRSGKHCEKSTRQNKFINKFCYIAKINFCQQQVYAKQYRCKKYKNNKFVYYRMLKIMIRFYSDIWLGYVNICVIKWYKQKYYCANCKNRKAYCASSDDPH